MHRIDTPTAQADKFGPGKNGFTGGNPQTGRLPTALDQDFFDAIQEAIARVIESAGLSLIKGDHEQLSQAMNKLFLKSNNNLAEIKSAGPESVLAALNNLGLGDGKGRLINIQTITTTSSYVPTIGTRYIIAELIGGGGGGGGAPTTGSGQTASGGGGGGGGYCRKMINSGFSGQQITIGAGGLGATGGAAAGDPGGNTTFMGMVAGGGGGGGPGNTVSVASLNGYGGNPGGSSGGDIVSAGDSGAGGVMYSTTYCSSGGGGGNKLYPFDYGAPRITNNNGLPGNAYGCGGGGGNNGTSQSTTRLGGTGSRGLAIIWEYA